MAEDKKIDVSELREAVDFARRAVTSLKYFEHAVEAGENIIALEGNITGLNRRIESLNNRVEGLNTDIERKVNENEEWRVKIVDIKSTYETIMMDLDAQHNRVSVALIAENEGLAKKLMGEIEKEEAHRDEVYQELRSREDQLKGRISALQDTLDKAVAKAKSLES